MYVRNSGLKNRLTYAFSLNFCLIFKEYVRIVVNNEMLFVERWFTRTDFLRKIEKKRKIWHFPLVSNNNISPTKETIKALPSSI